MSFDGKIRTVSLVLFACFTLVWLRLLYWQVLQHERLSSEAESQHFYSLSLPAKRGEILFSDKKPFIANKEAFLLYANLSKVPKNNLPEIADKLATVLTGEVPLVATDSSLITPEDRQKFFDSTKADLTATLLARLNIEKSIWVNLQHFISRKSKLAIEAMKFPGIEFASEQSRDYPEGSMSAHVAGFVGADKIGSPIGYFGLEGEYDRELSGKMGQLRVEKDAFGRPIAIGDETIVERRNGNNLVTTIDRAVQLFVEKNLEDGIKTWKASGGTAIVMDPNTGAILAMSSFPKYDPANFAYYDTSLYKNPAVANLFEPGSIMKPLVMAAAINENAVRPETKCDDRCNGPRRVGEYYVHTFDDKYHPHLTMTDTLVNSDNTGMIFVGEELGFQKLYDYMKKFGFSEKSGIDLEEEESGELRPADAYYEIDQDTLTFGQGIVVNSAQMVKAFATIANGGLLVTPHFVSHIIEPTGVAIPVKRPAPKRVITKETSQLVSQMMVQVAERSPVHFPRERISALNGFKIAAKSGTAQIAVAGKYKEKGTTASVIGFFPADKPRFLVSVKLNEPEVRPWGSDTSGPVFFSIIRDLVFHYGMTP